MDYYNWKTIATAPACRAVRAGAEVWPLPNGGFFSGGRTYTHGLKTKRGTCYVVCREVMREVEAAKFEALTAKRDPRQEPRAGDQLRDETGRVMVVEACYSLPHRPKQWQVRYTAQPGGAGCVCGLNNWRRYYRRAEVLSIAPDPM